eukprot:5097134-Lingulodinium_polyedra.AAC.1
MQSTIFTHKCADYATLHHATPRLRVHTEHIAQTIHTCTVVSMQSIANHTIQSMQHTVQSEQQRAKHSQIHTCIAIAKGMHRLSSTA